MTIVREDPGVWRATCDGCGDSIMLDADPDDRQEAETELVEAGWEPRPVDSVKFPADGARRQKIEYHEHDCPDCV